MLDYPISSIMYIVKCNHVLLRKKFCSLFLDTIIILQPDITVKQVFFSRQFEYWFSVYLWHKWCLQLALFVSYHFALLLKVHEYSCNTCSFLNLSHLLSDADATLVVLMALFNTSAVDSCWFLHLELFGFVVGLLSLFCFLQCSAKLCWWYIYVFPPKCAHCAWTVLHSIIQYLLLEYWKCTIIHRRTCSHIVISILQTVQNREAKVFVMHLQKVRKKINTKLFTSAALVYFEV